MNAEHHEYSIVLFDGHCNLCSGAVQSIIRWDHRRQFRFASLQSEVGRRILGEHGRSLDDWDTIRLLEGGRLYDRSTAALRIARRLAGPWPLFYALIIVPAPLRDPVYRWIARNRYRWFGRTDACMMPSPDIRARFLTE